MSIYSNKFYDIIRSASVNSAAVVAPIVYDVLQPKTVIDIGCGEGHWAKAFEDLGAEVVGVDGDYVKSPVVPFVPANLANSIPALSDLPHKRFDLVVSLEVAEHLPAKRADSFVADLCSLADHILFSAAIPSQGGVDHINEQWFSTYWWPKFRDQGFTATGTLRDEIWNDDRVEWWYKQNLMFITKNPDDYPEFFHEFIPTAPKDYVHPILWSSRT